MATLWITEFRNLGRASDGESAPVAPMPPTTSQTVTFTSTAVQSAAFGGATRFVRVFSDANCSLRFGDDPTAVTTDMPMSSGVPEYFGVHPGQKVSAITR